MAVFSKLEQTVMTDETLGLQKKKRMEKQKVYFASAIDMLPTHNTEQPYGQIVWSVFVC